MVSKAKSLNFSERGELEISEINTAFLNDSNLEVKVLNENTIWLDTGTVDSLMKANICGNTPKKERNIGRITRTLSFSKQLYNKGDAIDLG